MKKIFLAGLATGLMMIGMAGSAQATLTSGDFRTESDLPDYGSVGPLVYQNLGAAINNGIELTVTEDTIPFQNPSNYSGAFGTMDYNPTSNILTITSQDNMDFQTFDAWMSNIIGDQGDMITNVSMLSNSLTDPIFDPSISFNADSIHISWNYRPDVFFFSEGIAEFQITTSTSAVPEPATMLLFGAGLAGLAAVGRKK